MEMCESETKVMRTSMQPSPIQITIDKKKHQENVEYLNCFGSITYGQRSTSEIKSRIAMAKAAFNKKEIVFTNNYSDASPNEDNSFRNHHSLAET